MYVIANKFSVHIIFSKKKKLMITFQLQVPVIIDQNGCNENTDINFRFTGCVFCRNSTVHITWEV